MINETEEVKILFGIIVICLLIIFLFSTRQRPKPRICDSCIQAMEDIEQRLKEADADCTC